MNNNNLSENFLKIIKAMQDSDLLLAYKNSNDYSPEFVEMLIDEMNIRGYDATEIEKMSFENIDVTVIKNKDNNELVRTYYKRGNFKTGWDILAKNELIPNRYQ